ncbi:PREDICTED: protein YIPF6 [Nicrophorus vespilloides]|uniref:Protein YIPF n=1 Tax=Nicrophorus vespilloides TaxID=110193 RepID=A0ABM1MM21_NICVS|nr:PREDICTED: protein YIPF6 [Nicrophorus vespilloides]
MNEARLEMMDDSSSYVEGEMTVPSSKTSHLGKPEFNTLDEPIKETIMRDVKAVGIKFAYVLFPKEKKTLLKEWDLWGPLVLCTFMAMMLQDSSDTVNENDGGPQFAEVFVIVWIGSMIVTLNSKLLGGNISFFQSVCALGYCLLPTTISLIICRIILLATQTYFLFFLRLFVSMAGFVWATYASTIFLGDSQKEGRKVLAVYPIGLFYFIISWLVISHTN